MGQVHGIPVPKEEFRPFVNLPRDALESIWMSYNLHGEGWGLDIDQLREIFAGAPYMVNDVGYTQENLNKLFECFDTDNNGLVDALELLITLALASGMDTIDKLMFAYSLYDFDNSGELSRDEVFLLVRTAVKGLVKICDMTEPSTKELEKTTNLIFQDVDRSGDEKLSVYEFRTYCCIHPVVSSWMRYYGGIEDAYETPTVGADDPDVQLVKSVHTSVKVVDDSPIELTAKPWFELANVMTPEEIPSLRQDPPEDTIEPVFLHGIRSADTRSSVRYGPQNNILFHTSAVAVNMKKDENNIWKQSFMFDHDAPITCLDIDGNKKIVVTGDRVDGALGGVQREARLCLWDAVTNENKRTIFVHGCGGIRRVHITNDGKHILVLSADKNNLIMIYHTATAKLIYSSYLGEGNFMDVKFTGSGTLFAVVGDCGIDFFVEEGGSYMSTGMMIFERRRGLFQSIGRAAKGVVMTTLTPFERDDEMVSGNAKGQVLLWRGRNCMQLLNSHEQAVTTLYYNATSKQLASGSRDGKVMLYHTTAPAVKRTKKNASSSRLLEVTAVVNVLGADVMRGQIRAVCLPDDASKVLVATVSGELVELATVSNSVTNDEGETTGIKLGDDVNGGPILKSHWDQSGPGAVYGLCKVPGGFLSCGSDGSVRQWATGDDVQHKEVKRAVFDSGCRAVAASTSVVAVGMDGSRNEARSGSVHILSLETLQQTQELKVASDMITVLKFSPDGNSIAVGSADKQIYVLTTEEGNWVVKGELVNHTGVVSHIDFSNDGQFLRSCSTETEELLVWDVSVAFGKNVNDAETLKPVIWASFSCPYSWDVKGAYGCLYASETVQCIDRSNHLAVAGLSSGSILLTRLPAPELHAKREQVCRQEAHCGLVTAVLFIDDGARMVTAGAEDGLIQVWRVAYDFDEAEVAVEATGDEERGEDEEKGGGEENYDSGVDEDLIDMDDLLEKLTPVAIPEELKILRSASQETGGGFGIDAQEFEACNPWIHTAGLSQDELMDGVSCPPPRSELQLDYIYGFSGRSTRDSVKYTKSGDIVYPVSTVAVVYNKVKGSQLHAMNHSDEITCLAVCPSSGLIATAQRCNDIVYTCVWKPETGECVRRLNCGRVNGVSAICFNSTGDYIAVACQDMTHSILMFDWHHNVLRCRVPGGTKKVLGLCFTLASDDTRGVRLLQGGVGHFHLLNLRGRQFSSKRGQYGVGVPKYDAMCVAALPVSSPEANEFIIGFSNGSLGVIACGEKKIGNMISVQAKAITALCVVKPPMTEEGYKVVAGGVDGHIKVLDAEFQPIAEFNVYNPDHGLYRMGASRGIKSLDVDKTCRKIVYGTAAGEIAEISFTDGSDINGSPLVQGHCRDSLYGLSAHPLKLESATVGEDKTLRIWNLEKKKMMAMLELPDIAHSVCYSPTGQIIAIGLGGEVKGEGRMPRPQAGKVIIVSYMQGALRVVHEIHDAKKCINCFTFSPDGSELFVGSDDHCIYIYNVLDDFKLTDTLTKHDYGIKGLDISSDARLLVSADTNNEIRIWDLKQRGSLLSDADLKSGILSQVEWFTRQNVLGVDSLGVLKKPYQPAHITCLSQARDKSLFVTGDVFGAVSLFTSPAQNINAPFIEFLGHSPSGVSRVAFSTKDKFILSIGKDDRAMFQWKLEKHLDADAAAVSRPSTAYQRNPSLQHFTVGSALSFDMDGVQCVRSGDNSPPTKRPVIQSVIGFSCPSLIKEACPLPQAYYCAGGDIVTAAGSQPYSIGTSRNTQNHWNAERLRRDVGAVAVSADNRFVLVGEKSRAKDTDFTSFQGKAVVFAAATGQTLAVLPGFILGGVRAAAFSYDSMYAACLGNDFHHSITLYSTAEGTWRDAARLFRGQIDSQDIFTLSFIMQGSESEFQFATAGVGMLRFWKIRGRNATSTVCQMDSSQQSPVLCMTSLAEGQLVTGHRNGSLMLWDGKAPISDVKEAHPGKITAVCRFATAGRVGLMSSSFDGVNIWNDNIEIIRRITMRSILSPVQRKFEDVYITSLATDGYFKRLLATTTSACMLEVSVDSGAVLLVSEGNPGGSYISLAAHPNETNIIVTASIEGLIKLWDIRSQAALEILDIGRPCHDISFRKNGTTFAVASGNSIVLVSMNSRAEGKKMEVVGNIKNVGSSPISKVQYSPDDSTLAACSHDSNVYLIEVDSSKVITTLAGHSAGVDAVDFTLNGKYLRSFSRKDNSVTINYYLVERGSSSTYEQISDTSLINQLVNDDWHTVSTAVAPEARSTKGGLEEDGVSCMAISPDRTLLVAGCTNGAVRLFRNPATAEGAQYTEGSAHNGGIVACCFTCDSKHIVSTGAMDGSIVVWAMK